MYELACDVYDTMLFVFMVAVVGAPLLLYALSGAIETLLAALEVFAAARSKIKGK